MDAEIRKLKLEVKMAWDSIGSMNTNLQQLAESHNALIDDYSALAEAHNQLVDDVTRLQDRLNGMEVA